MTDAASLRIPARHPQWETRLADVVTAWKARQHRPRPGQDCAAFVLAAVEAVSGEMLTFDLRAYRTPAGQARALRALGWRDLPSAADACFGDRIPALAAHRGDVVSDGAVLGIMTSDGPVAFQEGGFAQMGKLSIIAAWPIGRADG